MSNGETKLPEAVREKVREFDVAAAFGYEPSAAEAALEMAQWLMEPVCEACGSETDSRNGDHVCRSCAVVDPTTVTRAEHEHRKQLFDRQEGKP